MVLYKHICSSWYMRFKQLLKLVANMERNYLIIFWNKIEQIKLNSFACYTFKKQSMVWFQMFTVLLLLLLQKFTPITATPSKGNAVSTDRLLKNIRVFDKKKHIHIDFLYSCQCRLHFLYTNSRDFQYNSYSEKLVKPC